MSAPSKLRARQTLRRAPRPPSRTGRRPRRGASRAAGRPAAPTRSRPRSSPCRRAGWSAGWRSGCRIGSARRDGRGDGVCANVEFPSPRRLVGERSRRRPGSTADADPWLPERAVWPLLEVVDGCLGEPWLAQLGGAPRRAATTRIRRGGLGGSARAAHRRAVRPLRAAPAGDGPCLGAGRGRRACRPTAWQAELWRRLRARIGVPGPAERLEGACARLRAEPGLVDLPARLSLFGLTRLPAGHLDVLRALAVGRDVHLFLLHPSPALWERVAASAACRRSSRRAATIRPRRCRRTGCSPPGGRTRARCSSCSAAARRTSITTTAVEHAAGTLLAASQADVRADGGPPGAPLPGAADERPAAGPGRPQRRRSTPATAAPARSRCCATRSCTCSPRTRRSSRATSSSCAPTSRPSRR